MSAATEISISVSEPFVAAGRAVEIILSVTGPGHELEGTLFLERARTKPGALEVTEDDFDPTQRYHASALDYDGPDLTGLHVRIEGVIGPAVYRAVFETVEVPPHRFTGPAFVVQPSGI